jgi:DNA (cytosine-5)-methyltransferase 1
MANLLCEHWELFSETWQTSGWMRNGQVFELPMREHHTTDSGFSSLPTPTTRDHKDGSQPHERDGIVQTDTVARAVFNSGEVLLPTTRTSMKNGATAKEVAAGNPKFRLEAVTNWGKFEPAIKRWEETLGRPAPAPTKPDGKDGAQRLSPNFTEWMMGVPEGFICDVDITRNEMLKACGNGVVPQQAELALRVLLEGITLPAGGGGK